MGFHDSTGFHPIRASKDYNEFLTTDVMTAAEKRAHASQNRQQAEQKQEFKRWLKDEIAKEEKKKPAKEAARRSLSQFVRRAGGIKEGASGLSGELRALSNRETGTSGLVNKNSRFTPERMAAHAREIGYPVSEHPGDFLEQVRQDAMGKRKIHSHADNPATARRKQAAPLFDMFAVSAAQAQQVRKLERVQNVHDGLKGTIVKRFPNGWVKVKLDDLKKHVLAAPGEFRAINPKGKKVVIAAKKKTAKRNPKRGAEARYQAARKALNEYRSKLIKKYGADWTELATANELERFKNLSQEEKRAGVQAPKRNPKQQAKPNGIFGTVKKVVKRRRAVRKAGKEFKRALRAESKAEAAKKRAAAAQKAAREAYLNPARKAHTPQRAKKERLWDVIAFDNDNRRDVFLGQYPADSLPRAIKEAAQEHAAALKSRRLTNLRGRTRENPQRASNPPKGVKLSTADHARNAAALHREADRVAKLAKKQPTRAAYWREVAHDLRVMAAREKQFARRQKINPTPPMHPAALVGTVVGAANTAWDLANKVLHRQKEQKGKEKAKKGKKRNTAKSRLGGKPNTRRNNPKVFEEFHGRPHDPRRDKEYETSHLAPRSLDLLGRKVSLVMEDGEVIPLGKRVLTASPQRKMWIAGAPLAKPNPTLKQNAVELYKRIRRINYSTRKDHLGDNYVTPYTHKTAEETKRKEDMPYLGFDREGYAVLYGGNYGIEAAGIRN